MTLTVAAPAAGLVGAWGFDERPARPPPTPPKGNTGALNGPARRRGRFGRALTSTAATTGSRSRQPSLDLTTGLTVEGWVYPTRRRRLAHARDQGDAGGLAWALYPFGAAASRAGTPHRRRPVGGGPARRR